MTTLIKGQDVRTVTLGIGVTKTLTNPQTTSTNIFTVTGGKVMITSLVGEVTVVQGATANSFNITYTNSGGSAADISAATVCTSDAVGTLYTITGVATDLLAAQTVTGTQVPTVTYATASGRFIVDAGAFSLKASGSNTGSTSWNLTYVPLDPGASVVAA